MPFAGQRQGRGRKGAGLAALGQGAVEALHRGGARRGDRDAGLGHFIFQPVQPGRIARAVFQQPRPLAHRGFIAGGGAGMAGIEAQHQPVEESPPSARAFDEQPVHRRRQPHHLHDVAQIGGALRRRAVQAHLTAFAAIGPEVSPVPIS